MDASWDCEVTVKLKSSHKKGFFCASLCEDSLHLANFFVIETLQIISGVKNHLSWCPGQVEFQTGQAYIFTQCPADK